MKKRARKKRIALHRRIEAGYAKTFRETRAHVAKFIDRYRILRSLTNDDCGVLLYGEGSQCHACLLSEKYTQQIVQHVDENTPHVSHPNFDHMLQKLAIMYDDLLNPSGIQIEGKDDLDPHKAKEMQRQFLRGLNIAATQGWI